MRIKAHTRHSRANALPDPHVSFFTKEARYEADRANVPVRLLDLDSFVRHYVEVYDKTDDETRGILPLTRIWWPA